MAKPTTPTYTQEQRDADIEAAIEDIEAKKNRVFEMVFSAWDDEREQLFALVSAVERMLCPEENDGDSPHHNAWRLCELAAAVLGTVRDFQAIKEIAMGEQHGK